MSSLNSMTSRCTMCLISLPEFCTDCLPLPDFDNLFLYPSLLMSHDSFGKWFLNSLVNISKSSSLSPCIPFSTVLAGWLHTLTIVPLRGGFMLQIRTLLLWESCWLSNKNLGFSAKFSWIEHKSVCFDKNKKILGYKIQILQLFGRPYVGSQSFNTLRVEWLGPLNTPLASCLNHL